jgi:hypothetical protein
VGRLAVGSHQRIAVNPGPQRVQAAQHGPQALLSRSASQEYELEPPFSTIT